MKQSTLAIHGCMPERGDAPYSPSAPAIELAASFHYQRAADMTAVANAEMEGFVYQRYGNPTAAALQRQVAALEGGDSALACSSGMAALHVALLTALRDRPTSILAAEVLFGETFQLLQLMEQQEVITRYADPCNPEAFEAALTQSDTGCILVETASNPLVRITPLDAICAMGKRHGVPVVVDATFTTPILSRPFDVGADIVMHSATKYLAGHADVLGGVTVCRAPHADWMQELGRHMGPNLGPFHSFLTMRGIKTLPLRMEEHSWNALHVAQALEAHPRVGAVHYPGLDSHPDKAVADRLFARGPDSNTLYGGMVSFDIRDADEATVFRFANALQLVVRATSLGDVHSLMTHPATTTHKNIGKKRRQQLGIGDNLVRISVGIEDPDDIAADLVRALEQV